MAGKISELTARTTTPTAATLFEISVSNTSRSISFEKMFQGSVAGPYTFVAGTNAGINATDAEYSVFIGVDAGYNFPASAGTGYGTCVGYQAGRDALGYAGNFFGYKSGYAAGGASNCGFGYGTLQATSGGGGTNNAFGVHCFENATNVTGVCGMGYHTGDFATNASYAVFVGDNCGKSATNASYSVFLGNSAGQNCSGADHSIFIGSFAGVNRADTIWIGTGASAQDGTYIPSIYIQEDNRKAAINGTLRVGTPALDTVADASAALEVVSTTQGLLLPRLTTTQRDNISSPAEGLLIYNTTTDKLNFRTASAWEAVTSA